MEKTTARPVVRVGVDPAKRVIQVHAVEPPGTALPRDKFLACCPQLPPGCTVAMETYSSAHHWARRLLVVGVQPRPVVGHFVEPYRMQRRCAKNDASDVAAICEAAGTQVRPAAGKLD